MNVSCPKCRRLGGKHCDTRMCPWRRCGQCEVQWSVRTGERMPLTAMRPPVPPEEVPHPDA